MEGNDSGVRKPPKTRPQRALIGAAVGFGLSWLSFLSRSWPALLTWDWSYPPNLVYLFMGPLMAAVVGALVGWFTWRRPAPKV